MNKEIVYMEKFKQDLINLANNSNLSVGSVYFIFKSVFTEIQDVYYNTLKSVSQEIEKEQE